jgi:hypothetical protein
MIIGKDVHPERKIYYWGAVVIDCIRQYENVDITYFSLYEELKTTNDISINIYSLTLDWLFLLGVIDGDNGIIKKCF